MSDPASNSSSQTNSLLTTPMAIVIAGGLIALALYFSNAATSAIGKNDAPTPTPAGNQQAAANTPTAPTIGDIREVSDEDHIRGAANAKVTIIEYSDLECPFCKRFHTTLQQVIKDYPSDVRWVYRHFPIPQLHQQAEKEAYAAECAAEQGKFWEFIDIVFTETQGNDSLDLTKLPEYARQAGVANVPQFQSCVDTEKYKDKVAADVQDAATAGGRGTPYSVVIGPDGEKKSINGAQPITQVKATIDSLLK